MIRFTASGPSISRKTLLQLVVSLTVRAVAYASLIGNMVDGTVQRLVVAWSRTLLGDSIGSLSQFVRLYGGSCVIATLLVLLGLSGWKVLSM